MKFVVTCHVMPDPAVKVLSQAMQDRMQKVFDLVHRKPKSAIQEF